MDLKSILEEKYLFNVVDIIKNEDSTDGNVYMVNTINNKYVIKIYNNLDKVNMMVSIHTMLINNHFHIPEVIETKDNELYIELNNKYIIVYTFLDGIEIRNIEDNEVHIKAALMIRRLHDITSGDNICSLNNTPFNVDIPLNRKSILHFDLTKGNIFYNENWDNYIGFIDFDDAKYGYSIIDIAIAIPLLFISKKNGMDKTKIIEFINAYYGSDTNLKKEEVPYIKDISIKWLTYTKDNANLNTSVKESFDYKIKLMEYLDI